MCGRLNQFAKLAPLSLAGRTLRIERRKPKATEDRRVGASAIHNLCPTDYAEVLLREGCDLILERMRFGLLPAWAKGTKSEVEKKFRFTFNARCETVFELASYRAPIVRRRCLVPVRGWHEWPAPSTPFYIHNRDDQPVLLAGVWDVWESLYPDDAESGSTITSMSVVTTPPGRYMAKFHDRSPLILKNEDALAWLQPGLTADDLRAFFKPYESDQLEAYRVSTAVNQARNKTEEVLRAIAPSVPQQGDESVDLAHDELSDLSLF